MALRKQNGFWYGESDDDLKNEISRYSKLNGYPSEHFAVAKCQECSSNIFQLIMNDESGVAIRICKSCENEHGIGDSDDFIDEAEELFQIECVCGNDSFHICCGVSLYENSEDVRWFYLGCRCVKCNLVGVYGDWKNEYIGYRELLQKI